MYIYARILFVVGFLLAVASAVAIYILAIDETYQMQRREVVIEVFFTVVLVFAAGRVLETMLHFVTLAHEFDGILKDLLTMPTGEVLRELAKDYDCARTWGEDVPTTVYWLFRGGIEKKWKEIQSTIVAGVPLSVPPAGDSKPR
jgi:hypothetical protein